MTLAGTGDVVAINAVREALEQENAQLRELVQRRADEAAAAYRRCDEALGTANDLAERLGQIADLCDEADAEAETTGWSLGGSVSTVEVRAAMFGVDGSAAVTAPATGIPDGTSAS